MWVLLAFRPIAWMSSKWMKTLKSKVTNFCGFLFNSLRFKMKSHLLKHRSAVAVIYCFFNLTTETEDSIKAETLYRRQIKSVTTFFLVVIMLLHILKSAERRTLRILSSCENSVDIVVSVLTPRDVWHLTVGDSDTIVYSSAFLAVSLTLQPPVTAPAGPNVSSSSLCPLALPYIIPRRHSSPHVSTNHSLVLLHVLLSTSRRCRFRDVLQQARHSSCISLKPICAVVILYPQHSF